MEGSLRAVTAADAGRGNSCFSVPKDYRVVLPPLPTGDGLKTTVVLHCDIAGRPYRIDDFRKPLKDANLIQQVSGIGAYQMSHVWLINFRTEDAKKTLIRAGHITVKDRVCLVIDPEKQEVRVKIHWLAFNVTNDAIRRAFMEFGEVKEVTNDKWKTADFESADSTSRVVRLVLRDGVSLERIPHQMRVGGGTVLVVVPGRAPICLRCHTTGHIRRDCRVPRCAECKAFGHEQADCSRSYARIASRSAACDSGELLMDEEDAERVAASAGTQAGSDGENAGASSEVESSFQEQSLAVETTVVDEASRGAGDGTQANAAESDKSDAGDATQADTAGFDKSGASQDNGGDAASTQAVKCSSANMDVDVPAIKRRLEDTVDPVREQRQRQQAKEGNYVTGKKKCVANTRRSSSLQRDDKAKL